MGIFINKSTKNILYKVYKGRVVDINFAKLWDMFVLCNLLDFYLNVLEKWRWNSFALFSPLVCRVELESLKSLDIRAYSGITIKQVMILLALLLKHETCVNF